MWGHSPEEALRRVAADMLPDSLHRRDETQSPVNQQDQNDSSEITRSPPMPDTEGTWGEREIGGTVSQRLAMQDFEELQHELTTRLTNTRSHAAASQKTTQSIFKRIASRASGKSKAATTGQPEDDEEARGGESDADNNSTTDEDEFPLEQFMRDGHLEKRTESGESAKKLGVVFSHLTVKGVASGASFVRTLPHAILGTFGPDLYRILCGFFPGLRIGHGGELRTILNDFTGVVRHGEMMMVLGRPGSGCSTFLKVIANNRDSYASVEGHVSYSGIPADEARKRYRGEVVYNAEDDQHLPTLTVGQTLKFSLLNKTRKNLRGDVDVIIDAFLRMFAIKHTENSTSIRAVYIPFQLSRELSGASCSRTTPDTPRLGE